MATVNRETRTIKRSYIAIAALFTVTYLVILAFSIPASPVGAWRISASQPKMPADGVDAKGIGRLFEQLTLTFHKDGMVTVRTQDGKEEVISNFWSYSGNIVYVNVKHPERLVCADEDRAVDITSMQQNAKFGMTFRMVSRNEMVWIIDFGVELLFERTP